MILCVDKQDGHGFMRLFRPREAGAFLSPASVPFPPARLVLSWCMPCDVVRPVRHYEPFAAYSSPCHISPPAATHEHMVVILLFLVKERRATYGKRTKKGWNYH